MIPIEYPLFVRKLLEGPIFIHTMDGDFITAVKFLGIGTVGHSSWVDIEDEDGDWQSINMEAIDYACEASDD